MQLLKRYKKNVVESENKQHVLFRHREQKMQNLAAYLQHQSELLSHRSRKVLLLFFIIIFSVISSAIIVNAVVNRKGSIDIKQISTPSSANKNPLATKQDSAITKQDYTRIELFKSYLFQLKNDSINKKKFDSIIQQRPHLLDSITLFEKMYLSQ